MPSLLHAGPPPLYLIVPRAFLLAARAPLQRARCGMHACAREERAVSGEHDTRKDIYRAEDAPWSGEGAMVFVARAVVVVITSRR